MELQAEWTPDCQGKWDFDADLVRLSCRYWPQGGGISIFDTSTGAWEDNDARPHIPPSAMASIYIQDREVAKAEFDGNTEAEVKAKVEQWARQQFAVIVGAVHSAYGA